MCGAKSWETKRFGKGTRIVGARKSGEGERGRGGERERGSERKGRSWMETWEKLRWDKGRWEKGRHGVVRREEMSDRGKKKGK